jgi:hypothetical protein
VPTLGIWPKSLAFAYTMVSGRTLKKSAGWRVITTLVLLIVTPILSVHAGAVNRTIDDYKGDEVTGLIPIYKPDGIWSYGPDCNKCMVKPEAGKVYGGSWHDGSARGNDVSNITLKFTG